MGFWKSVLPRFVLGCTALIVVLGGFITIPAFKTISNEVTSWVAVILPYTMIIGVIGLVLRTVHSIARSKSSYDRLMDVWVLVCAAAVSFVGLTYGMSHKYYVWFFSNVMLVVEGGTMGVVSLFGASAARRVLRLKNAESCFFITGLVLAFLTITNLGEAAWRGYPQIASFVDNVVSMAAMRGVGIAVAVGLLSTGLRVMLGIERSYLE